ncbi:MAG: hypothetical protein U0835_14140 [Isosphaeraceae bacterium]
MIEKMLESPTMETFKYSLATLTEVPALVAVLLDRRSRSRPRSGVVSWAA